MVVIGVLFADWLEEHLRTPPVIAVTLVVGALAMLAAERFGSQRRREDGLTARSTLLVIGVGQSTALVPGMSRSGSTIATAMLLGMIARIGGAVFVSPRDSGDRRRRAPRRASTSCGPGCRTMTSCCSSSAC